MGKFSCRNDYQNMLTIPLHILKNIWINENQNLLKTFLPVLTVGF